MSVERIIVETNDETGNNPVEYDWEFGPDGVFHMTGDGDMPAAFEESAAIVDAFNHVNMSIVNGERTPLKDGDPFLPPSSPPSSRSWRGRTATKWDS